MAEWEFLIQKEGDRSWLPLESPRHPGDSSPAGKLAKVEILEGRYRVVARSSRKHEPVQIRVMHLAHQEEPPRRRVQKRSGQINPNGLLVVMPFTHLQGGIWELHCASVDLMSDLLGHGWQYSVRLEVCAHQSEEDWDGGWDLAETTDQADGTQIAPADLAIAPPETHEPGSESSARKPALPAQVAEILGDSISRLMQLTDEISDQVVGQFLQPSSPPSDSLAETTGDADAHDQAISPDPDAAPTPEPVSPQRLTLRLQYASLIASRGGTIAISGWLEPDSPPSLDMADDSSPPTDSIEGWDDVPGASTPSPAEAVPDCLQLQLRDPRSSAVLVNQSQPLSVQELPTSFNFLCPLPADLSTHLLLGDVQLCSLRGESGAIALSSQPFTITINPDELVQEFTRLRQQMPGEQSTGEPLELPDFHALQPTEPPVAEPSEPGISLELSFLKPAPKVGIPASTAAVAESPGQPVEGKGKVGALTGQPLPPQIYHPVPEQPRQKSLDLPSFRSIKPLTAETRPAGSEADWLQQMDDLFSDRPSETQPIPPAAGVTPSPAAPLAERVAADPTVPEPPESVEEPMPETKIQASPEIELSCPIQMEFQALRSHDRFLSRLNSLATDQDLAGWLKNQQKPDIAVAVDIATVAIPLSQDRAFLSQEIVVDDDSLPSRHRHSNGTASAHPDTAHPILLPADEPIPLPSLTVIPGELVAGKSIPVRVRLPDLRPRLYVKVWVTDCQTRSLLDGPRWLVDFLPNGLGNLEATLSLSVPFGSTEIQIEAITVEVHTQRESHKAVVNRTVVPPDLPALCLEQR